MNKAVRDEYGIPNGDDEEESWKCGFCNTENKDGHTECRDYGRPHTLEQEVGKDERLEVLERLSELEDEGVLEKLENRKG